MARYGERRILSYSGRSQKTTKTRRPKDFGIKHLLWVLDRHEEELKASRGDAERREDYDLKGVRHSAPLYFGRSPTPAESASLSRTCELLVKNGEAVRYPRKGKKTHLRLTTLGWKRAHELRQNGGCSPREVDEAVRASSCHLREDAMYCFYTACYQTALKDHASPDHMWFIQSKLALLQMEVDRVERCCREHIKSLPLEQRRAEVKRLKNGGHWKAPSMFTDGGTGPFLILENDQESKAFN